MKKLKLNELNLGNEAEVLSREQLKQVLGGAGSGTGSGNDCCSNANCVGGDRCFYSGPEGCGYVHCMGMTPGGCYGSLEITTPPPCGWA